MAIAFPSPRVSSLLMYSTNYCAEKQNNFSVSPCSISTSHQHHNFVYLCKYFNNLFQLSMSQGCSPDNSKELVVASRINKTEKSSVFHNTLQFNCKNSQLASRPMEPLSEIYIVNSHPQPSVWLQRETSSRMQIVLQMGHHLEEIESCCLNERVNKTHIVLSISIWWIFRFLLLQFYDDAIADWSNIARRTMAELF